MRLVSQSSSVVWKVKRSPQERSDASGKLMINRFTSRLHNLLQHVNARVWNHVCVCVAVICMCTHTLTNQTPEKQQGVFCPLSSWSWMDLISRLINDSLLHLLRCHHTGLWQCPGQGWWQGHTWTYPQTASRQELVFATLNLLPCPPLVIEGILLATVQLLSQSCFNSFPITLMSWLRYMFEESI